jgi:hypothetical protein
VPSSANVKFVYSHDDVNESFLVLSHDMPLTHCPQLIPIQSQCCYIYLACLFVTDSTFLLFSLFVPHDSRHYYERARLVSVSSKNDPDVNKGVENFPPFTLRDWQ